MLLALAGRVATRTPQHSVNTVTTNVPGPQHPLYLAGRRMLESFPFVPLGGHVRVGVAIFSYDGALNFGVTGDYDDGPGHRGAVRRDRGRDRGAAPAGREPAPGRRRAGDLDLPRKDPAASAIEGAPATATVEP